MYFYHFAQYAQLFQKTFSAFLSLFLKLELIFYNHLYILKAFLKGF